MVKSASASPKGPNKSTDWASRLGEGRGGEGRGGEGREGRGGEGRGGGGEGRGCVILLTFPLAWPFFTSERCLWNSYLVADVFDARASDLFHTFFSSGHDLTWPSTPPAHSICLGPSSALVSFRAYKRWSCAWRTSRYQDFGCTV